MTTPPMRPLEASLVDLFDHLGIDRAHFVAGQLVSTDWVGLAACYPERIASLTLVSPRLRRPELEALGPRLMVLSGDAGPSAQGPAGLLAELTQAKSLVLRDYECLPWSDLAADRGAEITSAWLRFLDGLPLAGLGVPEVEGEAAGVSYRIRGNGSSPGTDAARSGTRAVGAADCGAFGSLLDNHPRRATCRRGRAARGPRPLELPGRDPCGARPGGHQARRNGA